MARAITLLNGVPGGLPEALKPGFEAFWAAYPARRPNPRAKAEARFAFLCRALRPDDLVEAARAFAAECAREKIEGPFVPHAATWLGEQRFRDYPPFASLAARATATLPEPAHEWWPVFRGRISPAEFRNWIAVLQPLAVTEGQEALVEAPTRFIADQVQRDFASLVARALRVRRVRFTWVGGWRP